MIYKTYVIQPHATVSFSDLIRPDLTLTFYKSQTYVVPSSSLDKHFDNVLLPSYYWSSLATNQAKRADFELCPDLYLRCSLFTNTVKICPEGPP